MRNHVVKATICDTIKRLNIAMFLIAVLFLCISRVLAKEDIVYTSKCPEVEIMKDFDIKAYGKGVWHEALRYPNDLQTSKKCIKLKYTPDGDNAYSIESVGIPEKCASYNKIKSTLASDANGSGNLSMVWTTGSPKKTYFFSNDYIVDTDYDNYSVIHSCIYKEDKKKFEVYYWICTRDMMGREKACEVAKKYKDLIKIDKLIEIDNSDEACEAAKKCCGSN